MCILFLFLLTVWLWDFFFSALCAASNWVIIVHDASGMVQGDLHMVINFNCWFFVKT
jgi:hypothetical protein